LIIHNDNSDKAGARDEREVDPGDTAVHDPYAELLDLEIRDYVYESAPKPEQPGVPCAQDQPQIHPKCSKLEAHINEQDIEGVAGDIPTGSVPYPQTTADGDCGWTSLTDLAYVDFTCSAPTSPNTHSCEQGNQQQDLGDDIAWLEGLFYKCRGISH
jgi:hypothetical protein